MDINRFVGQSIVKRSYLRRETVAFGGARSQGIREGMDRSEQQEGRWCREMFHMLPVGQVTSKDTTVETPVRMRFNRGQQSPLDVT